MKVKDQNSYILFGIDFGENPEQKELIRMIKLDPRRMPVVFCSGNAGTGKTFAALAASLSEIRQRGPAKRGYKSLYYVREPVEVGHKLGYLKGTEEDKYSPYLGPLLDNYHHLMAGVGKDNQESVPLKTNKRNLEEAPKEYASLPSDIVPLAPEFLRGRSFEDCVIIVDEAQNLTIDELHTICTRIGNNVKLIILGSTNQVDVSVAEEVNPFVASRQILEKTKLIGYVELKKSMRSDFVAMFDECFVDYKNTLKKK